jgi:hypothetical protein
MPLISDVLPPTGHATIGGILFPKCNKMWYAHPLVNQMIMFNYLDIRAVAV